MNCQGCQSRIEDFLDGELSQSQESEILAHLSKCRSCATARDALERENDIYARFYEENALDPSAEMWDAIRSRIAIEPSGSKRDTHRSSIWELSWFAWIYSPAAWRQVAFAVVLIVLSVATTLFLMRRNQRDERTIAIVPTPTPVVTPSPNATVMPESSNASQKPNHPKLPQQQQRPIAPVPRQLTEEEILGRQLARAEREYQSAIKLLDNAIAKRKDSLEPDVIKQYQASLSLIDRSIAESRQALHKNPADPSAGQFLLAAYARKVELMQDLAMR